MLSMLHIFMQLQHFKRINVYFFYNIENAATHLEKMKFQKAVQITEKLTLKRVDVSLVYRSAYHSSVWSSGDCLNYNFTILTQILSLPLKKQSRQ